MTGGYSSPGSVHCTTIGSMTTCNPIGGINIPASAQSYDANSATRSRYMARCLQQKGYSVLKRPICQTETEIASVQTADESPQLPAHQINCSIPSRHLN